MNGAEAINQTEEPVLAVNHKRVSVHHKQNPDRRNNTYLEIWTMFKFRGPQHVQTNGRCVETNSDNLEMHPDIFQS